MKNYSEMSDFEINEKMSMAMRSQSAVPESKYVVINDYCNNPADAWPIIESNKISLTYHQSRGEWSAIFNSENISMHGSPLRAAMIVFLMMQDANNG